MFIFRADTPISDPDSNSGMFLLQETKGVCAHLSEKLDGAGFQTVGIEIDVRLSDHQAALLRRKFGTKTIDREKCETVYKAILEGRTNAEIARVSGYKQRRIADIRATLFPTR